MSAASTASIACPILGIKEDDIACAIFLASGLKELGGDVVQIAEAFDADPNTVKLLLMHL